MLREITDKEWVKFGKEPPFVVYRIDTTDAYYFADFFDDYRYRLIAVMDTIKMAIAVADAAFVLENYKWDSLNQMTDLDAGTDIRVYDKYHICVYKAHEKYLNEWIGDK